MNFFDDVSLENKTWKLWYFISYKSFPLIWVKKDVRIQQNMPVPIKFLWFIGKYMIQNYNQFHVLKLKESDSYEIHGN